MSSTPSDLVIHPRNLHFGQAAAQNRWWLGGDPVATAWHNSLSVTFPQGEAFFIQSVKRFRKDVPAELAKQIDAFARQEAFHTREHAAFNRHVAEAGYKTGHIEQRLAESMAAAREMHPVAQLASTVALEHFTAIFANMLLKHKAVLAGADRDARRMWTWHAIEEVEHKAVAFDTLMDVTKSLSPFKRWMLRCSVFWRVSRQFTYWRSYDALGFLAEDGIKGFKARARLIWYLVGSPGVLRKVFPMWLSFFRPGFHPWAHDDRRLLAKAEAEFGLAPA